MIEYDNPYIKIIIEINKLTHQNKNWEYELNNPTW